MWSEEKLKIAYHCDEKNICKSEYIKYIRFDVFFAFFAIEKLYIIMVRNIF